MQAFADQHAKGAKLVLAYPGAARTSLPAGQTAAQDLADALDNVFNHPNVGPFIGRQLIEKLVASNPSPAYVQRISAVFDNDGTGRRGNLAAVVRAILLDDEARAEPGGTTTGKVREPVLRLTQLWRAYDAKAASGKYLHVDPTMDFGQGPLTAPSVFNFFSPFYAPPGTIGDGGSCRTRTAARHRISEYGHRELFLQTGVPPQLALARVGSRHRRHRHRR